MFGILAALTLLFVGYASVMVYEITLIMTEQLGYTNSDRIAMITAIIFGLVIIILFIATWLRDKLEETQRDSMKQNTENEHIKK